MTDTVSRGIKKMFREERHRHFPMPDYEIDVLNKEVGVTIHGNTIHEKYTQLLKENGHIVIRGLYSFGPYTKGTTDIRRECNGQLVELALIYKSLSL